MPNSLSRALKQKAKFSHSILSANNLLILCALFDTLATAIVVSRRYEELIAVNINPVFPATHFIAYPFLLLVACVGIRVRRIWSLGVAILTSFWLIIKIMSVWAGIAQGYELPIFSLSAIEYWWTYSELYSSNIIRLPITALILIYSIIALLRLIRRHRTKGNKILLSNTEA